MTKKELEFMETIIDRDGLSRFIGGVALICGEKAAHLRENWQDSAAAKLWDHDALLLEKLLTRVRQ